MQANTVDNYFRRSTQAQGAALPAGDREPAPGGGPTGGAESAQKARKRARATSGITRPSFSMQGTTLDKVSFGATVETPSGPVARCLICPGVHIKLKAGNAKQQHLLTEMHTDLVYDAVKLWHRKNKKPVPDQAEVLLAYHRLLHGMASWTPSRWASSGLSCCPPLLCCLY